MKLAHRKIAAIVTQTSKSVSICPQRNLHRIHSITSQTDSNIINTDHQSLLKAKRIEKRISSGGSHSSTSSGNSKKKYDVF